MKCFYHKDADGRVSAHWVRKFRGSFDHPEDFYPITYGEPFPFEAIEPEEEVWIVDFSIETHEMARLLTITTNVFWIDHHKTAIDKYRCFDYPIKGWRVDGVAGCMLTFSYLTFATYESGADFKLVAYEKADGIGANAEFKPWMAEGAPRFTKLIADWDTWTFAYGDETRFFDVGFGSRDFSPCSDEWKKFDTYPEGEFEAELVSEGKLMMRWRDQWAKSYMKLGFELPDWEGHRCYVVNLGRCNSEFFKSVAGDYEILMPFVYNGKTDKWTVSLYSETVDVQAIAQRYGGGGHKGAAGFQCDELPFWWEEEGDVAC